MKKIYLAIFSLGLIFPFATNASEVNIEELTLRAEESIRTSYELANQNWHYPENNEQRLSPPEGTAWEEFSPTTSTGTMSMLFWDGAVGEALLDSINTLLNREGLAMDCSNAARIIRLKMICDLLGEEKTQQWAMYISNSPYAV